MLYADILLYGQTVAQLMIAHRFKRRMYMRKFFKGATACLLGAAMLFAQQGVSAVSTLDAYSNVTTSVSDAKDAKAVQSDLFVQKIDGLSDDFIRGVDISSFLSEYNSGGKYYDFEGKELAFSKETGDKTFFDFLKECGVNWVRIRVWNDPFDADGNGYGGGNNDVKAAELIGKAATDAGLKVLIDFHYSDFWVDPDRAQAPKAWEGMTVDEKSTALGEFTEKSLNEILKAGVDVEMVQVGNESNNYFSGEENKTAEGKKNVAKLMKAGSKAVRSVAKENNKDIMVALHYTNIQDAGNFDNIAQVLDENGVDYDVLATSYYPFWHGSTSNVTSVFKSISEKYGKKVMIAEISYCYTMKDGDGSVNSINDETAGVEFKYAENVQGQANAVAAGLKAIADVGDAGLGAFYWEPAWIPVNVYDSSADNAAEVLQKNKEAWEKYGSGWASSYAAPYDPNTTVENCGGSSWDNQAMFDFNGKPLESINVWKYVYTGTTATPKLDILNDCSETVINGTNWKMPETVTAKYTDNSDKEIAVKWSLDEVNKAKKAGVGTYTINGTVTHEGKDYNVKCELTIKNKNLVVNPGFEDEDMSAWTIKGNGVGREADSNKRSGEYSLKYWSDQPVSFTAEQTVILNKGVYQLSAYNQGSVNDNGENAVYNLYAIVNGKKSSVNSKVTSWQIWENPTVNGIKVTKDKTKVTIGIKTSVKAGGWGAWDDVSLVKTGDVTVTPSQTVTKPAKVTNLKVKAAKKKLNISWKKVSKADGYQVQYSTNKSFKKAVTVNVKKCSLTVSKVKSKKTYYVRVRAYKNNGAKKVVGAYSKTLKVKVPAK